MVDVMDGIVITKTGCAGGEVRGEVSFMASRLEGTGLPLSLKVGDKGIPKRGQSLSLLWWSRWAKPVISQETGLPEPATIGQPGRKGPLQASTRLTLCRPSPYSTKLKTLANTHSGVLKPWLRGSEAPQGGPPGL